MPKEQINATLPTQLTVIRSSIPESLLALLIAAICFSASIASLHVVFVPSYYKSMSRHDMSMVSLLAVFNLLCSLVLSRWCADSNNTRLDFFVVVAGRFCSGLGILSALVVIVKFLVGRM